MREALKAPLVYRAEITFIWQAPDDRTLGKRLHEQGGSPPDAVQFAANPMGFSAPGVRLLTTMSVPEPEAWRFGARVYEAYAIVLPPDDEDHVYVWLVLHRAIPSTWIDTPDGAQCRRCRRPLKDEEANLAVILEDGAYCGICREPRPIRWFRPVVSLPIIAVTPGGDTAISWEWPLDQMGPIRVLAVQHAHSDVSGSGQVEEGEPRSRC